MKTILSKHEKKYIQKNKNRLSPEKIADKLSLPTEFVYQYLQIKLPDKTTFHKSIANIRFTGEKYNIPILDAFIKNNYLVLILLILMVGISYFNSLHNTFISDDINAIVEVHNMDNFSSYVLSRPSGFIQNLTYFIAFQAGGLNPLYFRLFNIFFHLGNSFLIFYFLSLLYNRQVGFIASLLFAVHPLLTESVVWISGAPYSYFTFFFLLTIITYYHSKQGRMWYLLSLFFFFLCCESNYKAPFLLPLLVLFEIFYGQIWKNWKKIIPFFFIGSFWIYILISSIDTRAEILSSQLYTPQVTQNIFLKIPYAISTYLFLYFWPDKLTLYHDFYPAQITQNIPYIIAFVCFFLLIVVGLFKSRWLSFWLLFFLFPLTPSLTPYNLMWNVAERYTYVGVIGLVAITGIIFDKLIQNKKIGHFIWPIFAAILLLLINRTVSRNKDWQTEKSFWTATLKVSPQDAKSYFNLAEIYAKEGNFAEAEKKYKQTLKIYPGFSPAYYGLGNIYLENDLIDQSIEAFEDALYATPKFWRSYFGLANVYYHLGDNENAKKNLLEALTLNPNDEILLENLATIYLEENNPQKAKPLLEKALQINPTYEPAILDLKKMLK